MECKLDLSSFADYDIELDAYKSLDNSFQAQFYSGETLVNFDFTSFSAATLVIKRSVYDNYELLRLSTDDATIILGAGGQFQLKVDDYKLMRIEAGDDYYYEMFLENATIRRGFLRGNAKINFSLTK